MTNVWTDIPRINSLKYRGAWLPTKTSRLAAAVPKKQAAMRRHLLDPFCRGQWHGGGITEEVGAELARHRCYQPRHWRY